MSLFNELRRRSVMRMGALYLVGAWAALQVADLLVGLFELADGTLRIVGLVLLAGFPVALVASWFYELTPQGIRRDFHRAGEAETTPASTHPGRLNYLIIGVLVLGLGVLLIDRYVVDKPEGVPGATPDLASAKAAGLLPLPMEGIAILPFDNLSEDEENAFFAAGIHEEVLSAASRLLPVKVTSRTSVMRVDPQLSVPEIGRTLGVAYVMEGSVRRQGDRIRVTVQLIDARDDAHVWAENFDATLDDVFRVQDEVAASIAGELQVNLDEPETRLADNAPTRNPEAYRLYLQALDLLKGAEDPRENPGNTSGLEAADKLMLAVELDPNFAAAWAQIPAAATYLYYADRFGPVLTDVETAMAGHDALAQEAAQRAVTLDPTLPEAHVALAGVLGGDERLAQYEEALHFDPNNVEALSKAAHMYAVRGENDIAREYLERALAADPLSAEAHLNYARLMQQQGRLGQALAHARRVDQIRGTTGATESILREQNELFAWIVERHREVYSDPSGNKMVEISTLLLEFDPSGEASERWLDLAYRFPDAGQSYELMVRAEIAMRRGDVERAEKIAKVRRELFPSHHPRRLGFIQRHREREMWDSGDRDGFIAVRSEELERILRFFEDKRGVDGYDLYGPGDASVLRRLALVAFSLGETELAEEAISEEVAYYDEGRRYWGTRSTVHVARAMQHVVRGEYDAALVEYEKAFRAGEDLEPIWRSVRDYVVVDTTPLAFFEGERFQALLERSRQKRREVLERLEAEAPQVLYPEEQLLTQLHEEWATDGWRARWAERQKYQPEDLED